MNNVTKNVIENCLIGLGITVSLVDIQSVLSIILLVVDVIWIMWKVGFQIYKHVKSGQYEEIENDIKIAHDELDKLTNKEDSNGKK